jgi:hypothetical protein
MLLSALVLRVIGHGFFAFPVYIKPLHILSSYFGSVVILFSHIPLLRMSFYFSKNIGRFIMHYLPTLLEILLCLIATSLYTQCNNVKIEAQLIHCPTRVSMLIDRS